TAASASARDERNFLRAEAMECHVTVATERDSVGEIEAKFGRVCPRSDVVRRETTLVLLAPTSALLALVAVTLEDRFAPIEVPRIAESFPGPPAFPVVLRWPRAGSIFPATRFSRRSCALYSRPFRSPNSRARRAIVVGDTP